MKMMNRVLVLASLMVVPVASANPFKLGTAVPADSFVYLHGVHNPKSEFIYKHWSHVFEAIGEAHIDEEIKQLMLSGMNSEEDRNQFEALWTRVMGLIKGVAWDDLCHHELVGYVRLQGLPEMAVIMRPQKATFDSNLKGLTQIFEAIAELDEDMTVTASTVQGAKAWTIQPPQAPVGLHLVHHQDVIALYITTGLEQCVSYLSGSKAADSMVQSPRFKQAMSHVPAPEDSVVFFDMHGMMSTFKGTITAQMPEEADPEYAEAKAALGLFDHLDVFDYMINSESTTGLQNMQYNYTAVRPEAVDRPLVQMITRQGALKNLSKYIPEDTTSFMAWAGVDLEFAYDAVIEYLKTEVPDGKNMIAEWEKEQVEAGFNLKKDLLSWISGEFVGLELPPAIASPMGGGDAVMMLKVRDGKRAMEAIDGWVTALNQQMGQGGQGGLMVQDATGVNAEGFRTINHPMLMAMGFGLSYGVKDDWLMMGMGGSVPAINKCLASFDGSSKSLLDTARYKEEGLTSKNPPMWVSFSDLSTMGQELSMGLGFLPMASAFMPPTPETQVVRSMFNILGKMAPALAQIDFLVSEAVVSSWNGKGWDSTTKVTYKAYEPKKAMKKSGEKKSDLDGL